MLSRGKKTVVSKNRETVNKSFWEFLQQKGGSYVQLLYKKNSLTLFKSIKKICALLFYCISTVLHINSQDKPPLKQGRTVNT